MLAQRKKNVGGPVEGKHLLIRNMAGEDNFFGPEEEIICEPNETVVIFWDRFFFSDNHQPDKRRNVFFIIKYDPDEVLDFLVRGDSTDKENVRPLIPVKMEGKGVNGFLIPGKIDEKRKDPGLAAAKGFELAGVERRICQPDVHDRNDGSQLLPAEPGQPQQLITVALEKFGGSDIVGQEDLPTGQAAEGLTER